MKKFQILVDSTSDLDRSIRERFDIDYINMSFNLVEKNKIGKNYAASLDWESGISAEEFYQTMRKGGVFKTGLISPLSCEEKFKEYLSKGLDILYISCSSKLSGSLNLARQIADDLLLDYKDRKIVCVDSLRATAAQGLIAIKASNLQKEGKSLEQVQEEILKERLCFNEFATVGSLEWLKKAGRVKCCAAFFGNLLRVKPIIIADKIGNNYAYKKEKGRKNALDSIINSTVERIKDEKNQIIFVEHADCPRECEYVVNQLKSKINPKELIVTNVGPIIGSTVGPDSIIISFYGEEVTIVGEE